MSPHDGAATKVALIRPRARNVRLITVRPGVEIDGVQRPIGAIVLQPREIASRLLASGACDVAVESEQ